MMKKFLFYAAALLLAAPAFFGCSEDMTDGSVAPDGRRDPAFVNSPEGAVAGTITVRVTEALADRIERTTRSGGASDRSGVATLDEALERIGTERFVRTFPYEERFEARHRAFGLHLWYTVLFDTEAALSEAGRLLSLTEGVDAVEFHHRKRLLHKGPVIPYRGEDAPATRAELPMNDPKLGLQWHYDNRGIVSSNQGGHSYAAREGADIDLYQAWTLSTGSPEIIVAVIDEPVQTTHADLAANIWTNPQPGYDGHTNDLHGFNFFNDTGELEWQTPEYDRDYGWVYADHGTHVGGTIAAVNGNATGVCGIAGGSDGAGGVKLMSCQIMGYKYKNVRDDGAARAFVYAADRGALIAQCSWGYDTTMKTQDDWEYNDNGSEKAAIDYFIATAGTDDPSSPLQGGLVIFAAGNDGDRARDQMMWPAAYAPAVAVSSMGPDYLPAYYTDYGAWADITAPGGDLLFGDAGGVLSTILDDPSIDFRDNRKEGYGFFQGTSMACPHVSGIAALGLSYAKKLGKRYSVDDFKSLLLSSANDIDGYLTGSKPYLDVYGTWRTLDIDFYRGKMGAGYLDAYKLLLAIEGTPCLYIARGGERRIALDTFFGGAAKGAFEVEVGEDVRTRLGMEEPAVEGRMLVLRCDKNGAGTITLRTRIGDTPVEQRLGLIVREQVAANGGWL